MQARPLPPRAGADDNLGFRHVNTANCLLTHDYARARTNDVDSDMHR